MGAHRIRVANEELVTVREAMRWLNRYVDQITTGQRDQIILTAHGKMLVAIVPLTRIQSDQPPSRCKPTRALPLTRVAPGAAKPLTRA